MTSTSETLNRAYYSIADLADRWRCSRATVYRQLRRAGAQVLDLAQRGKRGKKIVPSKTIMQLEDKWLRKMPA